MGHRGDGRLPTYSAAGGGGGWCRAMSLDLERLKSDITLELERRGGRVAGAAGEMRFHCPDDGHADEHPSARWNPSKGTWCCDSRGCHGGTDAYGSSRASAKGLARLLGIDIDCYREPTRSNGTGRGRGGVSIPPDNRATAQPPGGCTLDAYAAAKGLDEAELKDWGVSEIPYHSAAGGPALRISYRDVAGRETATRFRLAHQKSTDGADNRFAWRRGAKAKGLLYGLWRLDFAREVGHLTIVEGESDCHTLWHHGEPAIGLPGADNWDEANAALLDGIERIFVVVEPDTGGEAVKRWLATSCIRDRAHLVVLDGHKDPSALHLAKPGGFADAWRQALAAATPWSEVEAAEAEARRADAWQRCRELAEAPDVLDRFAAALRQAGVVGESRVGKLVYLAATSRLLDRPVSVVVKGPSSGGKSYVTQMVIAFFPPSATYTLSGFSERALAFSDEPLSHRVMVVYEAAGLAGDFGTYLLRTLLSEGRISYETVEKTPTGLRTRLVEREGPISLVLTTTEVKLHPENETRMLSVAVTDTREQTAAVIRAMAGTDERSEVEFGPWHALQDWIAGGTADVVIPFAGALAELVPPVAMRLRRDFGAVLTLMRAHALLHQASRETDAEGRIVAALDDYAVVRKLIAPIIADAVGSTVPETVRETVDKVRLLTLPRPDDLEPRVTTAAAVAKVLDLDKSAASRRLADAGERGYVVNLEDRRGRPGRWILGEPMPSEVEILPSLERLQGCTVAAGDSHAPLPSTLFVPDGATLHADGRLTGAAP